MTAVSVRFAVLVAVVGSVASVAVARAAEGESGAHYTVRFMSEGGYPSEIRTMSSKGLSFIRTEDGETESTYKGSPFSMAYSKDGSRLFLISEHARELLDVKSMKPIPFNAKTEPGYIGLTVKTRNGKLVLSELTAGGPAERSERIKVGDELVGVGEGKISTIRRVVGSPEKQATEMIRGVAGTYVQLEVIPKGQLASTSVTLRREAIRQVAGENKFVRFDSGNENENMVWCVSNNLHTFSSAHSGQVASVIQTEDVNPVGQYALSADAKTFAVLANRRAGKGAAVELFTLGSRECLGCVSFPIESWYQMAFSGDGSKLLIGTWDTVEVLDVKTRKFLSPLTLGWESPKPTKKEKEKVDEEPRGGGSAGSVAGAAADRNAFGGSSDVEERHSPQQLVACLACSSRGIVATGDNGGQVTLWDLDTGKLVSRMPWTEQKKVEMVQFSPDGKWLAYYVEGVLHLVDVSKVSSTRQAK